MKRAPMLVWTVAALLALGLLLGGCSELKKDLGPPTSPAGEFHGAGWTDTASANFHGAVLKQSDYDNTQCVKCHGGDFGGGTSGVSCYGCHALYPHDPEWTTRDSDSSHAAYLKRNGYDTQPCTSCHGAGLDGGTSGVSCNSCHGLYPHPPEWTSPGTQGFHGVYLKNQQYDLTGCASCHGTDFKGGSSGVSCYMCHASFPHLADWTNVASGASHGHYLKAKDWADAECTPCHGSNYTGGTSGMACFTCHAPYPHSAAFSPGDPEQTHRPYMRDHLFPLPACRTCHGQTYSGGTLVDEGCMESGCHYAAGKEKSPEACNTCHGNFLAAADDLLSFAPPKSVAGETLTSVPAVGAHTSHLSSTGTGKAVKCQECHAVPMAWDSPGHIDGGRAEIAFNDTLARLVTSNGKYVPQNVAYDPATNRCNNTFCHGNWRASRSSAPDDTRKSFYADSVIEGARYAPLWTGGSAEAACGSTCHQNPPKGHQVVGPDDCRGCHPLSETTHINGKINAFGTERDF